MNLIHWLFGKNSLWCKITHWCYKKPKPPAPPVPPIPPAPPPIPIPTWRMCAETGLEATKWCQTTYKAYTEPTLACRRHRPPVNKQKTADFIMFSFDIWNNSYTDDDLMEGITPLGESGCDYVRTFLGWPGDGLVRMQPFLRSGTDPDKFDLFKINPEWKNRLQKFQRMMAKCGMGIMMDFYGLQVAKRSDIPYAWFIAKNNINMIDGYCDTSSSAIYFYKWHLKQIMNIIGVEGNLVKLGNEQKAPGDTGNPDTSKSGPIRDWVRDWAVPLARYLKEEIGIQMPISCTGEEYEGTGKGIVNELEFIGWPWNHLCNHLHGLSLWEHFEDKYLPHNWANPKHYAISDDGSMPVPPEKRGICRPDGSGKCSANQKWRIDTIKRINDTIQHVRFIEWMPQEMKSDTCKPKDLDKEVSLDVYWKCAQALWNIDIRRKL